MVQMQKCFPVDFPTISLVSLGPDTSQTQAKTLVHRLTWTALLSKLHPQIPCHFASKTSARVSQILRTSYPNHVTAATR
jgi:hypothetical protein